MHRNEAPGCWQRITDIDLLSQDELLDLLGALGWEQAVGQVTYHPCMPVPRPPGAQAGGTADHRLAAWSQSKMELVAALRTQLCSAGWMAADQGSRAR